MTSPSRSRFDFGALASLYDTWYATDEGRRHDAAQKHAVLALLPTPATGGQCLLDVGCGTGHWSLFFAQQGYEVTGVDICPEMIVEAQARKALRGLLTCFGTVTIRTTTEEKSVLHRAPDGPAAEEHESEGRDACGAMLVARVVTR
jgi:2-polyprenyl-3-methyl-5-hydroxy-6-metoxy-1,4-benzoquinol methylase